MYGGMIFFLAQVNLKLLDLHWRNDPKPAFHVKLLRYCRVQFACSHTGQQQQV